MDGSGSFSNRVADVLRLSREEAIRLGHDYIGTEHFLLGIIREGGGIAVKIFKNLGVDLLEVRRAIEKSVNMVPENIGGTNVPLTKQAEKVLRVSALEAKMYKSDVIGTEHLLLALLRDEENISAAILKAFNVTYDVVRAELDNILTGNESAGAGLRNTASQTARGKSKIPSISVPADKKTPVLDNFSRDLTKLAANGELDPVVGREKEIERITQVLARRKKNNPILIGEPGVGKTAIVEGLAMRIVSRNVPRVLFDKRVVSLDLSAMVAGTKYRGQFEERIKAITDELAKDAGVIVFIDEIHNMVGAGSATGTLDAANIFKPALSRGELQCIGATTLDEYREFIEKDGALERRFRKILIESPTSAETLKILKNIKFKYEEHHCVRYSDKAIETCVRLSDRYITDRSFPDKAIDVMDEAGARVRLRNVDIPKDIVNFEKILEEVRNKKKIVVKNQNFEEAAALRDQEKRLIADIEQAKNDWDVRNSKIINDVTEDDIADVVAMMTGVPVNKIAEEENEKLIRLPEELKKQVVAQDEAVESLVKAIRRSRAGLKDPKRPIGSFMFLGPTGVGKTELAKALARVLFGSEDALIRVDMSEYMEKFAVSRLGGAPPGYVGYEEGGQLTEKVRRKPYSIILLDEIEKAHTDVYNMLLQIFDDGILTDGQGRKVDFKNTVIIMTSNIGTKDVKVGGAIGFGTASADDYLKETIENSVKSQFSPEFINRVDDFIYFKSLTKDDISQIIDIQMNALGNRLKSNYMEIKLSPEARQFLIDTGYDEKFGARPLKRAIQKYVEDELAELIITGKIKSHSLISADIAEDKKSLKFSASEIEGKLTDKDNNFIEQITSGGKATVTTKN